MTQTKPVATDGGDVAHAAPSDDENPILLDAEKAFVVTLIATALFVGAAFVFILL